MQRQGLSHQTDHEPKHIIMGGIHLFTCTV